MMDRAAIFKDRALALLVCVLLLIDCFLSIVLSLILLPWAVLTGQEGAAPSPYETMSARAGRGMLNKKLLARLFAWPIDAVFALWQPPHVDLPDGRRFNHPSHCIRAMIKTQQNVYLPYDYQRPLPDELLACFSTTPTNGRG